MKSLSLEDLRNKYENYIVACNELIDMAKTNIKKINKTISNFQKELLEYESEFESGSEYKDSYQIIMDSFYRYITNSLIWLKNLIKIYKKEIKIDTRTINVLKSVILDLEVNGHIQYT